MQGYFYLAFDCIFEFEINNFEISYTTIVILFQSNIIGEIKIPE